MIWAFFDDIYTELNQLVVAKLVSYRVHQHLRGYEFGAEKPSTLPF